MKVPSLSFTAALAVLAGCSKGSATTPAPAVKEDTVFEFVGRVDQTDLTLKSYGYLSHVAGLNDADLFTAAFPAWNESSARFTFVTNTTLSSRFVLPGVFSIAGSGDTTYYFTNTPTGSFSDPTTFATGTVIATSSGRYGDVNTVFAPGMGAISGPGQVTTGLATRTDPAASTSFTYFAGRAITIR